MEDLQIIFTHFIYCLMYFKFKSVSKKAIDQKTIFTRQKYGDKLIDNFSALNYVKSADLLKVLIISSKMLVKKLFGKKIVSIFKK